jgi:hypothetical protein
MTRVSMMCFHALGRTDDAVEVGAQDRKISSATSSRGYERNHNSTSRVRLPLGVFSLRCKSFAFSLFFVLIDCVAEWLFCSACYYINFPSPIPVPRLAPSVCSSNSLTKCDRCPIGHAPLPWGCTTSPPSRQSVHSIRTDQ